MVSLGDVLQFPIGLYCDHRWVVFGILKTFDAHIPTLSGGERGFGLADRVRGGLSDRLWVRVHLSLPRLPRWTAK